MQGRIPKNPPSHLKQDLEIAKSEIFQSPETFRNLHKTFHKTNHYRLDVLNLSFPMIFL
jgi:hypothetical protein